MMPLPASWRTISSPIPLLPPLTSATLPFSTMQPPVISPGVNVTQGDASVRRILRRRRGRGGLSFGRESGGRGAADAAEFTLERPFASLLSTTRDVLLSPRRFFDELAPDGPLWPPVLSS